MRLRRAAQLVRDRLGPASASRMPEPGCPARAGLAVCRKARPSSRHRRCGTSDLDEPCVSRGQPVVRVTPGGDADARFHSAAQGSSADRLGRILTILSYCTTVIIQSEHLIGTQPSGNFDLPAIRALTGPATGVAVPSRDEGLGVINTGSGTSSASEPPVARARVLRVPVDARRWMRR
jgi:hypothetical protein